MEYVILIVAMVIVGGIMTFVSTLIWKDGLPVGMPGAYFVGIITAIVVGLLDWVVIPAMGFSDTLKFIGVALEPALCVPIVFWVIKKARN